MINIGIKLYQKLKDKLEMSIFDEQKKEILKKILTQYKKFQIKVIR